MFQEVVSPGDHTTGVLSAATVGLEQRQVSSRHDDDDDNNNNNNTYIFYSAIPRWWWWPCVEREYGHVAAACAQPYQKKKKIPETMSQPGNLLPPKTTEMGLMQVSLKFR